MTSGMTNSGITCIRSAPTSRPAVVTGHDVAVTHYHSRHVAHQIKSRATYSRRKRTLPMPLRLRPCRGLGVLLKVSVDETSLSTNAFISLVTSVASSNFDHMTFAR